jgi:hypothetical protein
MKPTLFVIGLILMSSIVSMSQDKGTPDNSQVDRWKIVQALSIGQRLVVETRDGKTVKGKFQSGDDRKISLQRSGSALDISKDNVKRVYIGKKKRSILGGVLGGLGGMLLLGGLAASDDPGNYDDMVAGGAGLFGGAILGGKLGAKTQKAWLIYEAP